MLMAQRKSELWVPTIYSSLYSIGMWKVERTCRRNQVHSHLCLYQSRVQTVMFKDIFYPGHYLLVDLAHSLHVEVKELITRTSVT